MNNEIIAATPEERSDGTTALFTPKKQDEVFARMKALYERSGMSSAQLANVTYISERTISRYFAGKTKDPHFYTLCTMIIALGGDINEITGVSVPSVSVPSAPADNPYGDLITSYRNEAKTLRSALEQITSDLTALTARLASANKFIAIRTIALIAVIAVFCALEIVDICNPDWGRYQWVVELFGSFLHKV